MLLNGVQFAVGMLSQTGELLLQPVEILVRKIFKPDHLVAGSLDGSDQFVEFQVYSA